MMVLSSLVLTLVVASPHRLAGRGGAALILLLRDQGLTADPFGGFAALKGEDGMSSKLVYQVVLGSFLIWLGASACSGQRAKPVPAVGGNPGPAVSTPSSSIPAGALSRAVRDLNENEVRRLLELGADPNERVGSSGEAAGQLTPLHIAVLKWDAKLVNLLLDAGASPLNEAHGYQPVDLAIHLQNDEIARILVAKLRALDAGKASPTRTE